MRLQRPQFPEAKDSFGRDLVVKLRALLTGVVDQINSLTEGRIAVVQNATTAAPTTGTYQPGDVVRNKTPAELGAVGSKYVVTGWLCVAAPTTFVEMRCLTGN